MEIIIKGLKLVQTCGACPEQYDVFDGTGALVGYLRLRHGYFSARYNGSNGKSVYCAETEGDGSFYDHERYEHLTKAVKAIKKELKKERKERESK